MMADYAFKDFLESSEMFDGLASVRTALPRFASKFDYAKCEEGAVIDIDEDVREDQFDEDEDEFVYDSSILSNFYSGSSSQVNTTVEVMEDDKIAAAERSRSYFNASNYALADFDELEKQMDEIPVVEDCKIFKEIIKAGNGQGKIPERCKIFFHYIAFAEADSEPFDSTLARRIPYVQDMRCSSLIPGFEVALRSMEIGEAARFVVPPELAYRDSGVPPRIPPNAKILYVVEMLHKIDEELLKTFPYLTPDERAQLPFSEVFDECYKLRSEGNSYYSVCNYEFAIRKWRRGIVILEGYPVVYSDDEAKRNKLLWTLYSNLAGAYLHIGKPAQACNSCKFGLKIVSEDASKAKLLFRFARAKLMFNDVGTAKQLIEDAAKLEPNDRNIRELKIKIYQEEKLQDESFKGMCGRMMSALGGSSNSSTSTDQASSSRGNGNNPHAAPENNDQAPVKKSGTNSGKESN